MKTSESIVEIATAISALQSTIKDAYKGTKGYGYNYAPLDIILKDNRTLMSTHGLSHIQSQSLDNDIVTVTTRIMHKSGEWIETTAQSPFARLKGMNDYQSLGSGITYLRRYGLSAALGIAADEDQDAHGEQVKASPPPSKATDKDKEQVWSVFKGICGEYGVDAKQFLKDIGVEEAKYYEQTRKWLQNEGVLRDQLDGYLDKPSYMN